MLYHRFTIISLFALGAVFVGLLLMNESNSSRPVLLSMIPSNASVQKEASHPHRTLPDGSQEQEVHP